MSRKGIISQYRCLRKNQNRDIALQKLIKKVTDDIESFNFNTAISQMMIMANEIMKLKKKIPAMRGVSGDFD